MTFRQELEKTITKTTFKTINQDISVNFTIRMVEQRKKIFEVYLFFLLGLFPQVPGSENLSYPYRGPVTSFTILVYFICLHQSPSDDSLFTKTSLINNKDSNVGKYNFTTIIIIITIINNNNCYLFFLFIPFRLYLLLLDPIVQFSLFFYLLSII